MLGDHAIDLDARRGNPVDTFDGGLQHLRPAIFEQTGRITELQLDTDLLALDIDCLHTAGADGVQVQVRVGVLAKNGFDGCASDGTHGDSRDKD
ncbi:hypothetical protein D3C86_2053680 [compost metagenome]